MAFQRLAHPDGELATARAAAAAGAGVVLSTLATTSIEDVRAAANMPLWFQLYIYRDREASRALVERAERAGCTALVLTVDSPLLGRRERDARNGFHVSADFTVPNLTGDPRAALAAAAAHGGDGSSLARNSSSHTGTVRFHGATSSGCAPSPSCRFSSKASCAATTPRSPWSTAPRA